MVGKDVQDPSRVTANRAVIEGQFDDAGCALCRRPEPLRLSRSSLQEHYRHDPEYEC